MWSASRWAARDGGTVWRELASSEFVVGAYVGGAFDGRYVYFAPRLVDDYARFDSRGDFGDAAAWTFFDAGPPPGYFGAGFDGRYVYYASTNGTVTRYDTSKPFEDRSSFETFSFAGFTVRPKAFAGVVFDGRYVYFLPINSSVLARFDARSPPAPPGPPSYGSFL